jgi:hypothetical protein
MDNLTNEERQYWINAAPKKQNKYQQYKFKAMAKQMTKADQLNALYKECNLSTEDIHKHKHYVIIKRTGIEKIQYAKNINVQFEVIQCSADYSAVKAIGEMDGLTMQTFGSAYPNNSQSNYYLEMAEKRALSRVVLKITKLYSLGVFGEDEADDFKRGGAK